MRAFIDHTDGMVRMSAGEITLPEIRVAAELLRGAGAWIADHNGGMRHYPYSGYVLEPDDNDQVSVVFVFGPGES